MLRRSVDLRSYLLRNINVVIRFLVFSDILVIGSAAMLAPIFALFITDFIKGGNEIVAGVAAGIYLITKSVCQIPVAAVLDRIRGEKDDYWFMITFTILMSFVPLFYLVIDQPWQLYVVQFVLGLFSAMTYPSFMAIFTRHIDKRTEATEWGVYYTLTDLSSAGLAAIGGVIAGTLGFPILICVVVFVSVLGGLALIPIKPYIK